MIKIISIALALLLFNSCAWMTAPYESDNDRQTEKKKKKKRNKGEKPDLDRM